jgi:hypothetical protein
VCLAIAKHYYSVPYTFLGKKVKILYSQDIVEVFYKFEKIATHVRDLRKHRYTTEKSHMASHHKYVAEWRAEYFIEQGNALDPGIGMYLEKLIDSKPHPEQGYKSCIGILNQGRRVGTLRLASACKRATEYQVYNYPIIEDILHKRLEETATDDILPEHKSTPNHQNIRGKNYYN